MTDAELTLLGLVSEGPRYGYEIQQIIDDRGLREWMTIGFSSIYYILNKLERQGLLTSELRADSRGPARKVYAITDAGEGILHTAIIELLRQPRALGSGFELGLVNLAALKSEKVHVALSHHRQDLALRLEAVEREWDGLKDHHTRPDNIRALFTHSIATMRAELNWLITFVAEWEQSHPAHTAETAALSIANNPTLRSTNTPDPAKMIQRLKRPVLPPQEPPLEPPTVLHIDPPNSSL